MASATDLYDPDRLSKIGEILPKFLDHAEAGDVINFGLEGDPCWPSKFNDARPTGTIMRMKDTTYGRSMQVKMNDTGKVVTVAPNSIDPQRVWEFDDDTFQNVLKRSMPEEQAPPSPGGANVDVEYRASSSSGDVESLRAELDNIKRTFATEMADAKHFNNTIIATINEMASDICKVSNDAPFCKVFTSEYRSMLGQDADADAPTSPGKASSPFDSDFSDSDVE